MKKISIFFLIFCACQHLNGQTNYRISYDKLSDELSYYKLTWLNGELTETQVKAIRLQQNDVVQVEVKNVNPFTFATEVYMGVTEVSSQNASPIATIMAGFSAFGGPAMSLLTSLASRPPDPVYATRGEQDPMELKRQEISVSAMTIYQDLTEMLEMYQTYDQQVKVKFSRSLSQDQIISRLDSINQVLDFSGLQEMYDHMLSEKEHLTTLKESVNLAEDDAILKDLQFIENKISAFQEAYLDEDGHLKTIDINTDLFDVEVADFSLKHTFTAKSANNYGTMFASNEYFIVFSEIKGDDPEFYPIDFVKKVSVPIQQPKAPYWLLTAQNIYPLGGINNYNVQVVYEDYFLGDSILVQQSSQKGGLLSFGTMLGYDFENESPLIPSVLFGAAISGVNKPQENWALSLALGGGLTFRKFPYLSVNGGVSLTQTKVLKQEYFVNRAFIAPENANAYNSYEGLFTTQMKPSFFFGIGFRL
jgi:hypothetical protein